MATANGKRGKGKGKGHRAAPSSARGHRYGGCYAGNGGRTPKGMVYGDDLDAVTDEIAAVARGERNEGESVVWWVTDLREYRVVVEGHINENGLSRRTEYVDGEPPQGG